MVGGNKDGSGLFKCRTQVLRTIAKLFNLNCLIATIIKSEIFYTGQFHFRFMETHQEA